MSKKNTKTWTVTGRRLQPPATNDGKSTIEEGEITLPEFETYLNFRNRPLVIDRAEMDRSGNPKESKRNRFGTPITADLAVEFMRDARADSLALVDDKTASLRADQKRFIADATGLLYGITFDRSIVLRILSQPRCEGLRMYLCKRPNGDKWTEGEAAADMHASLVLVGVDGHGFDLNFVEGKPKDGEDDGSLIVEYGFPPDGNGKKVLKNPKKQYVLLRRARMSQPANPVPDSDKP
ncbi:hypothetical protein [Hufsiella ginkgonis]|uniref:Uncharacterized protein n=1 Tax=Hufsiella ginkgonis TaxID=2695274 RepID=A0A7K1XTE2_9SPHI|nr:hypothetical protein [Hufsiella ginkgonis]MXV14281.1 hypothetical protein [Hufsiella ginkgonis]